MPFKEITATELKEFMEVYENQGYGKKVLKIWDPNSEQFEPIMGTASGIFVNGWCITLHSDSDLEEK